MRLYIYENQIQADMAPKQKSQQLIWTYTINTAPNQIRTVKAPNMRNLYCLCNNSTCKCTRKHSIRYQQTLKPINSPKICNRERLTEAAPEYKQLRCRGERFKLGQDPKYPKKKENRANAQN